MNEAYIFDHVRTPRGKGKSTGVLHEIPPVDMATQILSALRERNQLPTDSVDDIVPGVLCNTGEQGGGIARAAALCAGFEHSVPGYQLKQFCFSGLAAVNRGAAQIIAGQAGLVVAGGMDVVVLDISQQAAEAGVQRIRANLDKGVSQGKVNPDTADTIKRKNQRLQW